MSDTPSPTPSEDNRRNLRDETASLAIDKAMNTSEQSQDQLLNSFMFLKKADVDKNKPILREKNTQNPGTSIMETIMSNMRHTGQASRHMPLISSFKGQTQHSTAQPEFLRMDRDGIEEEILEEGESAGQLSCARIITGKSGSNLKVDNYVEEDEDSDPDQTEGYVASFGQGDERTSHMDWVSITDTNTSGREPGTSTNIPDQVPKADSIGPNIASDRAPAPDFTSSLSLDDHSTDKLLLNFLADLQNEQNNLNEPKGQKLTRIEDSSEDSIEAFLQKKKKSDEAVDFSDNDDDAVLSLVDNSNTENVKVLVNHQELHEITKPDSSVDEFPPKLKPKMIMDSEGNLSEELDNDNIVEPTDSDVSSVVFPGEIVEEQTSAQCKNDRLLEFKVTYKTAETTTETDNNGMEQSTSDVVEPFHLDADFDYDNVVLTPKYSTSDMERLQKMFSSQTAVN